MKMDFFRRSRERSVCRQDRGMSISSIFILFFFVSTLAAQTIERKIIIEKGMCYYTTIDPEFQIATLHVCSLDKPVKMGKAYAVPAGRNLNVPVIPFSWDLMGKDVFVINFMNNALNNRRNALKRIPMNTLKEWDDKLSISDVVMKSTETQPYTWFEPYSETTEKSPVLDHFFFDAISTSDSSLCLVISNNNELTVWEYNQNRWRKGEDLQVRSENFFSLFSYNERPYLVTSDGSLFAVQNNKLIKLADKKISQALSDGLLIINKMDHSISFLNTTTLDEQKSLSEIIKLHATNIFL